LALWSGQDLQAKTGAESLGAAILHG
jgi:hypothetical protein